ncbi:ribose-5-phosphate isomerase RpiA [Sulfidibacter corallicola]|uniref:Ribose-5-phosphate isomerase A n=1 Tax=Sulfidibacter corallicola TaxID=2818388 RepID=A0A8A4TN38_SULCO|nr:ribose-5-phosphate isomerase RpiA [Sulfidibacter corallicola]QTD50338.1 ribose-5-phosphate isomerase RpiA [Sulfidibacter corallicola]
MTKPDFEKEKERAALHAVGMVSDGMWVGLGSGSTIAYAVRALGERVACGLDIQAVPTSRKTRELAASVGIPLRDLPDATHLDLTIDGADECDPRLDLIKGGGGALLHEKIVASASRRLVIIVDSRKPVPRLLHAFPLPVEVIPLAIGVVSFRLRALGAGVTLRRLPDGTPFVTDEGNRILDLTFVEPPEPTELARSLEAIPGLVEHGLFLGMTSTLVIGRNSGADVEIRGSAGVGEVCS